MASWEVQLILIDDIALQSLDVAETADFYELVRARHRPPRCDLESRTAE